MPLDEGFYSQKLKDKFAGDWPMELLNLLCGERLGHGMTREVFQLYTDPNKVIKFELESGHFQNVLEWNIWQSVQYVEFANKWFAPCHYISHCGRILIQSYCEPLATIALPAEVPAYFTDLKPGNWGVLNKQPVCFDYGKNLMLERGMTKRMRKADWT